MELLRRGRSNIAFYVLSARENSLLEHMKSDASVISVTVENWNRDMSPWQAEKCFKDGEDFGGGAGIFLAELVSAIPEAERRWGIAPVHRAICGYSLAGLCALYGLYMSDMFDGAASVSGSVWFDGWTEFMKENCPAKGFVRAYLSVGDREARTRNLRLASVEECARKAREILVSQDHEAIFELNPGNHFFEPDKRLARGMDALFEMYLKN